VALTPRNCVLDDRAVGATWQIRLNDCVRRLSESITRGGYATSTQITLGNLVNNDDDKDDRMLIMIVITVMCSYSFINSSVESSIKTTANINRKELKGHKAILQALTVPQIH